MSGIVTVQLDHRSVRLELPDAAGFRWEDDTLVMRPTPRRVAGRLMPQVRIFPATVVKVHDGDTISASVDCGFHIEYTISVRLNGCNAPELSTPEGKAARDYLADLLPTGSDVTVTCHGPDKYGGRWDCDIHLPDGTDVVERLIADGHAAPWDGHGPKPVPPA